MSADILLVTTWDTACGIAEHSAMLKEAVEAQSQLQIAVCDDLAPEHCPETTPIIHLNYHAALHSLWTPAWIRHYQQMGKKVVVTYHDTGVPNNDQCLAIAAVADQLIVHEACEDLPHAHYIRMGVSAPRMPYQFGAGPEVISAAQFKTWAQQPVLGTIGFAFGWKNYDALARLTAEVGWALLIIAPDASPDQIAEWHALNPALCVYPEFIDRGRALSLLSGCDATAFTYVCHNTGQSGAILQGIAARKPVIALKTCRQFRALYLDAKPKTAIRWAETFDDVQAHLTHLPIQRVDPATVALAEQESWTKVAKQYIEIYQGLL